MLRILVINGSVRERRNARSPLSTVCRGTCYRGIDIIGKIAYIVVSVLFVATSRRHVRRFWIRYTNRGLDVVGKIAYIVV